jgi:NAD(P)-dependent dehydrogenase (short-subunit alcohol dehydrogenase family)
VPFAKQGARLGLLTRRREGLEGAQRDVEDLGGRALVIPVDVADAEGLEQAAAAVEREFGPIDIWINNAMVSVFSPRSHRVLLIGIWHKVATTRNRLTNL